MYKAIASFWSKSSPPSSNRTQPSSSSDTQVDEDTWVIVTDNEPTVMKNTNEMTNSWIETPPLIKTDEVSTNIHHFNPIENLLIEHASMSVYEQIASKTRNRRQKKVVNDVKLDEQTEEDDDEDEEDKTSINQQPNLTSIHHRTMNLSSNSSLDSSTSSLVAHHRHLHRLHQRRKRSKLLLTNHPDESKQVFERQLLHHTTRTPKTFNKH